MPIRDCFHSEFQVEDYLSVCPLWRALAFSTAFHFLARIRPVEVLIFFGKQQTTDIASVHHVGPFRGVWLEQIRGGGTLSQEWKLDARNLHSVSIVASRNEIAKGSPREAHQGKAFQSIMVFILR